MPGPAIYPSRDSILKPSVFGRSIPSQERKRGILVYVRYDFLEQPIHFVAPISMSSSLSLCRVGLQHMSHSQPSCFLPCVTCTTQVYIATFAAERDKYRAVAEAHRLGCSSSSSSSNCSCVQSRGEGSSSHVQISTRPEGAPAPAATTDEDHCYRTLFGAFDDPVKYSGAAPTDSYLQHVWRMWFKDLTPQSANGTPSWTLGDYERRVQHLWTASRPSTHSSQSSTSPSPMPAPPPPPLPQEAPPLPQMTDNAKARADLPSLSAPLQSLEPLAVADHQLMQAPGSHLEDSMSTVLASSSPTPPLLEVHFSSQFDVNATREQQHRGLYREPFSSAKTSR